MGPFAQRRRTLRRIRRNSRPAAAHFPGRPDTGATRVITNSVRRGLANGASAKPKMSSDGRFVAFQSEASDLVAAEDFNLLWDVFVFDRTTGAMSRVSGDPDEAWMEPSGGPSIDATRFGRRLLVAPPDRRIGQAQ